MYGDDYLDIWTINKLHHLSGSGYTCDHVRFFDAVKNTLIFTTWRQTVVEAVASSFDSAWLGGGLSSLRPCGAVLATGKRRLLPADSLSRW